MGDWLRRVPVGQSGRTLLKRVYHAALMMSSAGRGLRSEFPGGEAVYVTPAYRYLSWNPVEYSAFREAIKPGAIVLDVGANVGAYSLLFAQWAGPSGKVYAFEPSPQEFQGLVRHVTLNGMSAVVAPVHAAMSDTSSQAQFVVGSSAGQGRLASAADAGEDVVNVPVSTIDEFCAREGVVPDFIKIDVEGSETAVLRGARETLRRGRGRIAVFVEVHPAVWSHIGTSQAMFENEVRSQALTLAPLVPMDDLFSVEGMCLRVASL
jgi:FkbM family methyltransferase